MYSPLIVNKLCHKWYDVSRTIRLETAFPEANLRPRSNETHLNAYFFITPDGMLQVVDRTKHVSVADLLAINDEQLQNVIDSRYETVDKANQNRTWLNSQ